MASFKAVYRPRRIKSKINVTKLESANDGFIYVIYTHNSKSKYFSTGVKVDKNHWDERKEEV